MTAYFFCLFLVLKRAFERTFVYNKATKDWRVDAWHSRLLKHPYG